MAAPCNTGRSWPGREGPPDEGRLPPTLAHRRDSRAAYSRQRSASLLTRCCGAGCAADVVRCDDRGTVQYELVVAQRPPADCSDERTRPPTFPLQPQCWRHPTHSANEQSKRLPNATASARRHRVGPPRSAERRPRGDCCRLCAGGSYRLAAAAAPAGLGGSLGGRQLCGLYAASRLVGSRRGGGCTTRRHRVRFGDAGALAAATRSSQSRG